MKPDEETEELWFPGYRPETSKEKMWRKCKENPFVPFGRQCFDASLVWNSL